MLNFSVDHLVSNEVRVFCFFHSFSPSPGGSENFVELWIPSDCWVSTVLRKRFTDETLFIIVNFFLGGERDPTCTGARSDQISVVDFPSPVESFAVDMCSTRPPPERSTRVRLYPAGFLHINPCVLLSGCICHPVYSLVVSTVHARAARSVQTP